MNSQPLTRHAYVNNPSELFIAWQEANRGDKKMRARDAAEFLGVSECELVACQVGTDEPPAVTRLEGEWVEMLKRVGSLGRVMALTRNHAVVHERKGCYKDVSATGPMGLAIGDDIDLRLFFSQWRHGYALVETDGATIKRSLQFFDAAGEAVHKIFLQPESDVDEFDMLVEQFRAANQTAGERVLSKPPCVAVAPDSEIDVDGMRAAWDRMRDTHEFFGLLKKYGVARTQALRLADPEYVTRVATSATKQMLEHAAASGAAIMCFVGNHGCIQIHTGPVANIKVMGPWLNVLDPDFNLHLREDLVHELWIVKKPTSEGIVTSLEVFDRDGLQIAQFFGKRKPGLPEREDWREIVEHLPRLDSVAYVVPTGASIDEKQVAA